MDKWEKDDAAMKALADRIRPDLAPPPGAWDRLERRLRQAVRQRERRRVARKAAFRRWVARGTAAAAVIVLAVIAGSLLLSSTATAGFAEVARQVQRADSVAHRLTITAPGRPAEVGQVLIDRERGDRTDWHDGKSQIRNTAEPRSLILTATRAEARFVETSGGPVSSAFLDMLATAVEADAEFLGIVELDGERVEAYRLPRAAAGLLVWADPKTYLPVRMEAQMPGPEGPTVLVLDEFRWNVTVPEGAFDLSVPAGYTLVEDPVPTEEDLLKALRLSAQRSDGVFPESFDLLTVGRLAFKDVPMVPLDTGANKHFMAGVGMTPPEEDKQFFRTCRAGLAYVKLVDANETWEYVGGGIALGNADEPVCWWRPEGAEQFRVVYADLRVRDVAPDDMPEVP